RRSPASEAAAPGPTPAAACAARPAPDAFRTASTQRPSARPAAPRAGFPRSPSPTPPACLAAFPVPTDLAQAAWRAHDGIAAVEAVARHARVTEREVVFDRVTRVERGQPRRDLLRHLPRSRAPACETDGPAHVLDVRIHRHDQARRRDAGPEPEVRPLAPHHPAQEEQQALARSAGRRQRKQVAIAARAAPARKDLAQVRVQKRSGEALQRGTNGAAWLGVAGEEALFERAVPRECVTRGDTERDEVPRSIETIDEGCEARAVARDVEVAHERDRR